MGMVAAAQLLLVILVQGLFIPVQPSQAPARLLCCRWLLLGSDKIHDFPGSAASAAILLIRPSPGEPPGCSGRRRSNSCCGARLLVAYNGGQAALIGALPLLSAAVAIPFVLWNAVQICAVSVACTVAACTQANILKLQVYNMDTAEGPKSDNDSSRL